MQASRQQAKERGAERVPAVEYAETFTTFDGKPIKDNVIESLPETVTAKR